MSKLFKTATMAIAASGLAFAMPASAAVARCASRRIAFNALPVQAAPRIIFAGPLHEATVDAPVAHRQRKPRGVHVSVAVAYLGAVLGVLRSVP